MAETMGDTLETFSKVDPGVVRDGVSMAVVMTVVTTTTTVRVTVDLDIDASTSDGCGRS